MISTVVMSLTLVALVAVVLFALRRVRSHADRGMADLGVVSTRWITELRRDEPWQRS
jgi:hypothetical protein